MPCYHPLQAFCSSRLDGKKDVFFSNALARRFALGLSMPSGSISIPCGSCIGCRLERSRQWALRMMNEASLFEDNCFLTLTFDDKHLSEMCPNGSLDKSHVQCFLKRLRKRFVGLSPVNDPVKGIVYPIRTFYCGEYGDRLSRPHYHVCLFNFDFSDKVYYKSVKGYKYYNSSSLSDLWPFGHSVIGGLDFESAAYVARYCTKKVTGSAADDHYQGRLPEFAQMSLKPGIGRFWIDKFGKTDVFPYDECVSRGVKCKPPRYYDKLLEASDPEAFMKLKVLRAQRSEDKAIDNTSDRLLVKEKCMQARIKSLVRSLECINGF